MVHVPRCSWALSLLLIAGCVGDEAWNAGDVFLDEQAVIESTQRGIIGGTVNTGDPAVVGLYFQVGGGGSLCTGSLISPRVVLTAAHCVDDVPQPGPSSDAIAVVFGGRIAQSGSDIIGLRRGIAHSAHPAWDTNDLAAGHDIAMILLDSPAPVAPIAINRTPLGNDFLDKPEMERWVRLTGFGRTNTSVDNTEPPTKRQVTSILKDLTPDFIGYGARAHNACQGDSGGPNFMTFGGVEYVTGITSFGDRNCAEFGYGTRVDRFADDFVDPFVRANDTVECSKDGACASGCTQPDPDCPCAADGLCTAACTDNDSDPDCPTGCGKNGECRTECPVPDPDCGGVQIPSGGGVGERCENGAQCADEGLCISAPDDPRAQFCTRHCQDGDCPASMMCVDASDGGKVCVYDGHTPGAAGAVCTESSQCNEGLCLEHGSERFCSSFCDDDAPCAGGMACVESTGPQNVCVPDDAPGGGICSVRPAPGAGYGPGAFALLVGMTLLLVRRRRS